MDNLVQEGTIVTVVDPQSLSSAATAEWISMKNYDRVDFILNVGAITTGGKVKVREAVNVSGSSAATLNFDHYWKCTATTDVFTKTSADSSSSANCITIGNSSDNKCWYVSIPAAKLSDGFDCVTITMPSAFASALTSCIAVCHKTRYKSSAPPTALTD